MDPEMAACSAMHAYRLNNAAVEWVDTFKYLGVRIHPKLRWSDHITDVATKANRILNLLRRSMYGCSRSAKHRAYSALVRPHLEYCPSMESTSTE